MAESDGEPEQALPRKPAGRPATAPACTAAQPARSGPAADPAAIVAAIAEREPKPKRVVFRARRVLATSGWNGERYRLLVKDEAEARARMDELGVAVFVQAGGARFPHDLLIERVTQGWKREVMPGFVVRVNPMPVVGKKQVIEQQRLGRKIEIDP